MNTYLDYYNEKISPSLKAIDLFLKTEECDVISFDIVGELLDLSHDEILSLMKAFHLTTLDKVSFFTIMQYGSSPICKLFAREVQRKIPHFYSFYDISYIYQIPYDVIVEAAEKSQLSHITNKNLHKLFNQIPLTKHDHICF